MKMFKCEDGSMFYLDGFLYSEKVDFVDSSRRRVLYWKVFLTKDGSHPCEKDITNADHERLMELLGKDDGVV